MSGFVYDGWRARCGDLDGLDVLVVLLGPHAPNPAHVFLSDVVGEEVSGSGYARFSTSLSVTFGSGQHVVAFDDDPGFDTHAIDVPSGWVVAVDAGSDATAELVRFEPYDVGSVGSTLDILTPDGLIVVAGA